MIHQPKHLYLLEVPYNMQIFKKVSWGHFGSKIAKKVSRGVSMTSSSCILMHLRGRYASLYGLFYSRKLTSFKLHKVDSYEALRSCFTLKMYKKVERLLKSLTNLRTSPAEKLKPEISNFETFFGSQGFRKAHMHFLPSGKNVLCCVDWLQGRQFAGSIKRGT